MSVEQLYKAFDIMTQRLTTVLPSSPQTQQDQSGKEYNREVPVSTRGPKTQLGAIISQQAQRIEELIAGIQAVTNMLEV